jgi:hypothetical protein
MIALIRFLLAILTSPFKSKSRLEAENASVVEQGCADLSRRSADWGHKITRPAWRTPSPLRPDIVFGTHRIDFTVVTAAVSQSPAAAQLRPHFPANVAESVITALITAPRHHQGTPPLPSAARPKIPDTRASWQRAAFFKLPQASIVYAR